MNTWQIIYIVWLAGIFWVRNPNPAMWVLLVNALVTLAACEAMDLGLLSRAPGNDQATMAQMLIDFVSLATLLNWRGLSKVIAAGYMVTVPVYSYSIIFGGSIDTTFAVVMAVGYAQLVAVSVGSNGGNGRRRLHRLLGVLHPMASSRRIVSVGQGDLARDMESERG